MSEEKQKIQPVDSGTQGDGQATSNGHDSKKDPDHVMEPEVLESLPPEVKRAFEMAVSVTSVMGPRTHPLISKLNDGHITTILEQSGREDERDFQIRKSDRRFGVFYVLVAVAVFVFLTMFLVEKNIDLYEDILKLTVAFAGGLGSGFGLKTYIDKKRE